MYYGRACADSMEENDTHTHTQQRQVCARWRGFSMSPQQINCHSVYQLALAVTYHLFNELLFVVFAHCVHSWQLTRNHSIGKACQYQNTYSISSTLDAHCKCHTGHGLNRLVSVRGCSVSPTRRKCG